MTFMQKVISRSKPIWDSCAATPFVRGLIDGTLPEECFRTYMIQDSLYLKQYARMFGLAIYRAQSLRDIQLYASVLCEVTDSESTVRLRYLQQLGLTDDDITHMQPLPACQTYMDFLQAAANRQDERELLMAVLPCMLSYSAIFRQAAAQLESSRSRYADFILDYADDAYAAECVRWSAFADAKCSACSDTEQRHLCDVFTQASWLELDFWNMAMCK